jgi:hypothetical protein
VYFHHFAKASEANKVFAMIAQPAIVWNDFVKEHCA